ncbi:MAG: hypothetical protein ACPGYT_06465 [Nitrospirales bacterium]
MSISHDHGQTLVGAPNAVYQGRDTGLTYLFDREGTLLHTFKIPHIMPGALFGQAVALSSQSVIIAAPHGRDELNTQTGAVYLFDRKIRNVRLTLNNPSPTSGVFGHAIAVAEQHVLVGDPQANSATAFRSGAVYLFDEVTGVLQKTFRPQTEKTSRPTQFGQAVSLTGRQVFISAPFGGTAGSEAGMVYLFDKQTGKMVRTFEPPISTPSLAFGWSFVVNDRVILIGAFGYQGTYREEGIAYLYDIQSGKLLNTFTNPHPTERARFGISVSLFSDLSIVAATGDHVQAYGKIKGGEVYVFASKTGALEQILRDPFSATGASDVFGHGLFSYDDSLLISAPFGGAGPELDAGLVYLLNRSKLE